MTAEVIDGEAIEMPAERALVVPDQGIAATGALALAALPEDEFNRRLDALEKGRDRVERIQRALMSKDVDYGLIPGTPKPTLYKPGAEILCQAYGLAADFTPKRSVGDGLAEPHLSYLTRCDLHLGSLDGPVVAVGYGAANSWERKHRYRRGERTCPNCGKQAIIKGKAEYGGGWLCWPKKDGCNSKWRDGAPEIEGQAVGDVENPDPFDLDVVLAKMAEKRAHVDATLRATNASRLFTQDVEDLARPADPDPANVDPETGEIRHPADGLIGVVAVRGNQDLNIRDTEQGEPAVLFRLTEGNSSQIVSVVGPEALALNARRETLIGQRVKVWGHFTNESFVKGGKKIGYTVLHASRVETSAAEPIEVEPLDPEPTEAASEPLFSPDEDAFVDAAVKGAA